MDLLFPVYGIDAALALHVLLDQLLVLAVLLILAAGSAHVVENAVVVGWVGGGVAAAGADLERAYQRVYIAVDGHWGVVVQASWAFVVLDLTHCGGSREG